MTDTFLKAIVGNDLPDPQAYWQELAEQRRPNGAPLFSLDEIGEFKRIPFYIAVTATRAITAAYGVARPGLLSIQPPPVLEPPPKPTALTEPVVEQKPEPPPAAEPEPEPEPEPVVETAKPVPVEDPEPEPEPVPPPPPPPAPAPNVTPEPTKDDEPETPEFF